MRTQVLVLMLVTCTVAIQRRSHSRPDLRVIVKPKYQRMYYGQRIKVRCKVRSIQSHQTPDLSFYRRWDKNTVVRLSSGNPGIKISPVHTLRHRMVAYDIKIDSSYYKYLHEGKNEFYCLGTLDHTKSQKNEFVIFKEYPWLR